MKLFASVIYLLLHFHSSFSQVVIRNYPVGAIFDVNSAESAHAAFRHAIDEHNERVRQRAARRSNEPFIYNFELDYADRIYHIDVADPFAISMTICQLATQNVVAIYGLRDLKVENVLRDFTRVLNIPYLTSGVTNPNLTSVIQNIHQMYEQDAGVPMGIGGYQIQMRPPVNNAIIDLISHLGWHKITYIFDTNEALLRLQYIYEHFSRRDIFLDVYMRRVDSLTDCTTTLESLSETITSPQKNARIHVIMDIAIEKLQRLILSEIRKRRNLRFNYHYLTVAVGMNELNLSNFADGGMNITGLRIWNSDTPAAVRFRESMKNLSSIYKTNRAGVPYSFEAAFAYDAVKVLVESLRYLHDKADDRDPFSDLFEDNTLVTGATCRIPRPFKYGDSLLSAIIQMPAVEGATGPLDFEWNGLRKNYSFDVWDVSVKRQVSQTATWFALNPEDRRLVVKPTVRPISEKGVIPFKQRIRIVTSVLSPPFLMLVNSARNGRPLVANERFQGFCADFMVYIADDVKFEYVFKLVKDGNYGTNESGTWNGMIGELVRWEADMAVAPLTISVSREDVIDFSQPFLLLGLSLMVYHDPDQGKLSYLAFLTPLSYEIWMCIIFTYVAVSVVLFLVSRFSPTEWHLVATFSSSGHDESAATRNSNMSTNTSGASAGTGAAAGGGQQHNHKVSVLRNDFTIGNSMWFVSSAFMHQGTPVAPRSIPGRIVGAVWWFFTLIVISSYTANLAAFLTVERMNTPIKSVEDLVKQKQVKYGILNSGSSKDFFRNSKVPTYERMWTYMESNPDVFMRTTQSGVERVKNSKGNYAFLLESIMNSYWNERAPCTSKMVGDWLDSKGYGIGHSRPSDIRDKVNLAVLNLKELRVLTNLEKKWWHDMSECKMSQKNDKDESQDGNSLRVDNILGLLLILMCGLVIGLLIAVCELLYKVQVEAIKHKKSFFTALRQVGEPIWKLKCITEKKETSNNNNNNNNVNGNSSYSISSSTNNNSNGSSQRTQEKSRRNVSSSCISEHTMTALDSPVPDPEPVIYTTFTAV